MRLSQRRRMINDAKIKAEHYLSCIIADSLADRYRMLKRELRRSNLRAKMYRSDGLYKDDLNDWQDWINDFTSSIENALAYVASFFTRVEDMFFAPAMIDQGMQPQAWNTDKVVQDYQERIGRQIKNIGEDTLSNVQQAVSNWYTTEQSLPDLIDTLSQWFDPSRAEAIATTEIGGVASEIAYQQMNYMGITRWQWDAFPDACPICDDLNGQTFDVEDTDAYPPAPHPRCKCGVLYLDDAGNPLSYGSGGV